MPPTIVSALLPDSLAGVNFEHGRAGGSGVACPFAVDMLVIHVTEGDAASVRQWFNNPAAEASAHYMVTKAGAIVQFVDEDDKAYGVGRPVSPTARLVKERFAQSGWGANSYSISIEHEGDGTQELTEAQRAASYELLLDIIARRGIPVDRDHIIGHHESKASKTCPGKISVDRIVADLQATITPPIATSQVPGTSQPPIVPARANGHPRVVYSRVIDDYLAVVGYRSDTDWSYVRMKELESTYTGARASTPLSQMPLHPDPVSA